MAQTANPADVLLVSTVIMTVAQSYGATLMLDSRARPALFWRYPNVFLALGVLPGLAALIVFAWSFLHLPWWEPLLTGIIGVAIAGPLVTVAIRSLGDTLYTVVYMLSPVAAVLLAARAFGYM